MAVIPHRGTGPLEWEDPEPHVLTVTGVIPPAEQFDSGELEYTLEHLPTCPIYDYTTKDSYICGVAHSEEDGIAFSLDYSGTPITKPGRYLIKAWGRRIPHWEYGDEYDGGVMVVDE